MASSIQPAQYSQLSTASSVRLAQYSQLSTNRTNDFRANIVCADGDRSAQHSVSIIKHTPLLVSSPRLVPLGITPSPWTGCVIALTIFFVWATSLLFAFGISAESLSLFNRLLLAVWFTFLYTGLFVTGHDAMHGSVAPASPRLNDAFGRLALLLYGFISYKKLRQAHEYHHQFPASHRDPDFHNGRDMHAALWYLQFMRRYWTLRQWVSIVVVYNGLHRLMGVPEIDLLLFWAIPSLLSSVQLFYFGTYLVHRHLPDTYSTPLCANSTYWPYLISLVTCYHFGYHREHHAHPEVPWWQLPQISWQTTKPTSRLASQAAEKLPEKCSCAKSGKALATISSPLVQGDRTRLKT